MRQLLALAAALTLVACGQSDSDGDAGPAARNSRLAQPVSLVVDEDGRPLAALLAASQVLHRGNGDEPQTLDPHLAEGQAAAHILRDLFEGLTTIEPDGRIVPGAAAHWDISRDGLTYTFYLDPEGRWSDGEPVRAEDFVWSWRRLVDPRTGAGHARMLAVVSNARAVLSGELAPEELGVSALNDTTFQVSLDAPTPYFLGLLSHPVTYPVHRASFEAHGSGHVRPGRLISNGAFRLDDWLVRSRIELARNPYYRRADQVIIERVVYFPLEDENSELNRFRAGDLHWTHQVPSGQFRWLDEHMTDALQIAPLLGSYFLGFNLGRYPFRDNPELRQALNLAIDRDIITAQVTRFGETPTFNLVPPGLPDHESFIPEAADWTQAQREAEARRLYTRAGYSDMKPLNLELRYNTSENHRRIAVAIAAMWKETLGVRTRLANEEFRVFLQNRAQRRNTEAFRAGWLADYDDPFSFLDLFHSGHARNDAGYDNPRYDRLLDQIAAERIPSRRRNLMAEAERMLLADQVILPVFVHVSRRLVDPRLQGWQHNPLDQHLSRHMFFLRDRSESDLDVLADSEEEQQ